MSRMPDAATAASTMILAVFEWQRVPVAAWVIVLAAAVFAVEFIVLKVRLHRHGAVNDVAERRLIAVATALRNHARDHGQLLPGRLEELGLPGSEAVAYRAVPRLDEDERLILVHDVEPVRRVIEFPVMRAGRGLIFCNGRLHVVSEDVFDKLRVADDALRDRLGLEPIEFARGPGDSDASESKASNEG